MFFASALLWTSASAQSLIIQLKDGTTLTQNLSELKKITFVDNSMVLYKTDASTQLTDLTLLSKLYFASLSNLRSELYSEVSIQYASSNQRIYFSNLSEKYSLVCIFSSEGKIQMQEKVQDGSSIDVSQLKTGVYFIQVEDKVQKILKK